MRVEALTPLLALFLILASSCATQHSTPHWVYQTPEDNPNVYYIVGGPARTLPDARSMVFQELAERLHQNITTQTHLRSLISAADFNTFVNENLQTWVEIGSDAVIAGVEVKQRWQDPLSKDWWILATISDQLLIESYQKTIEVRMEKESAKESHLATLKDMILPYYSRPEGDQGFQVIDDIRLLASAYGYLNENVISSPKSVEIDGRIIELDAYIQMQLMKLLDGIKITVSNYQPTIPINSDLGVSISVSHGTDRNIGVTPLAILVDNQYVDASYRIQGNLGHVVLNRKYFNQDGTHRIRIQFDGRGVGAEKYSMWNRLPLPQVEFSIEAVVPKLQWQFNSESSYNYTQADYLSAKTMAVISTQLGEDFSTEESALGQMKIILRSHEGTQNPYGILFLHGLLEIVLYDNKENSIYRHVSSSVTASGTDLIRTEIQLADQLVLHILQDKTLQKDLQIHIERLKSQTKEQHHEKNSI